MAETQNVEKHGFQTEVKQLLHLMIHSLYSNKEIFLRELISNASDAADKLRFKALQNNQLFENDGDLHVRLSINKDAKTITISDNGIGMTRDEVMTNLGTIAKSGTKEFFSQLSAIKQTRLTVNSTVCLWVCYFCILGRCVDSGYMCKPAKAVCIPHLRIGVLNAKSKG